MHSSETLTKASKLDPTKPSQTGKHFRGNNRYFRTPDPAQRYGRRGRQSTSYPQTTQIQESDYKIPSLPIPVKLQEAIVPSFSQLARLSQLPESLPAGRLRFAQNNWKHLDTPNNLRTYSTLITQPDPQYFPEVRTGHFNSVQENGITSEITQLISKGAILELLAVLYALQAFWPILSLSETISSLSRINVLIYSDNRTVVAYINKMGGTHSIPLLMASQKLWTWSLDRKIWLQAQYLPGKENVEADSCSRTLDASNWRLKRQIFLTLAQIYGPFPIDLFADRTNSQLPIFFSWKPDPQASQVNALIQNWTHNSYAFPPFSLIEAVLHKIHRECLTIMLIAPVWRGQVWYPKLLEMLIYHPVLLPLEEDLLLSPLGACHPLIQEGSLTLAAFRLSGDTALQKAFRARLPPSSSMQHQTQRRDHTMPVGANSLAGVNSNRLIHFKPLPQT